MKRNSLFCLLVISLFLSVRANADPVYNVIDLGTLGGDYSFAYSINNEGQIVGDATDSSGKSLATKFDSSGSGNNINLDPSGYESLAYSINNKGQIVGTTSKPNIFGCQAVLFDASGQGNNVVLIGSSGGVSNGAASVNDAGQVVGWKTPPQGGWLATLFDISGSGNNINLDPSGYDSAAYSINNKGQIVGWSTVTLPRGALHDATLFDPSGGGNNIYLGTLSGGFYSEARSINDNGQIVGIAETSPGMHATLFDPTGGGNNIDLGTLGGLWSWAYSINNKGQILGYALNSNWESRATLFDPTGGGMNIDLNTLIDPASGWYLGYAYSINDRGWIVGQGINPDGDSHAFLLVPEPATIALFGLGILCFRRRAKHPGGKGNV
jgi:probable HAF family extracellular repeat protein